MGGWCSQLSSPSFEALDRPPSCLPSPAHKGLLILWTSAWALGHAQQGCVGGTQAVGGPSMAPGASLGRSTGRNQVLKPASGGCNPMALSSQPVWAVSVWGTSSLGIPPVQWELPSPRSDQSKGSGQFHSQGWRPLQAGVPKGQLAT